jgi:transcriptional regulator with GAF, ATPase, and Fis domain
MAWKSSLQQVNAIRPKPSHLGRVREPLAWFIAGMCRHKGKARNSLNFDSGDGEQTEGTGNTMTAALDGIIGHSTAMQELTNLVLKVAPHDCTVLIRGGESGTGKELVARSIQGEF